MKQLHTLRSILRNIVLSQLINHINYGIHTKIKNIFKRGQPKVTASNETINLDKGFHPEILFLINKQYAEYVDYVMKKFNKYDRNVET